MSRREKVQKQHQRDSKAIAALPAIAAEIGFPYDLAVPADSEGETYLLVAHGQSDPYFEADSVEHVIRGTIDDVQTLSFVYWPLSEDDTFPSLYHAARLSPRCRPVIVQRFPLDLLKRKHYRKHLRSFLDLPVIPVPHLNEAGFLVFSGDPQFTHAFLSPATSASLIEGGTFGEGLDVTYIEAAGEHVVIRTSWPRDADGMRERLRFLLMFRRAVIRALEASSSLDGPPGSTSSIVDPAASPAIPWSGSFPADPAIATRQCPSCGDTIQREANHCTWCSASLPPLET